MDTTGDPPLAGIILCGGLSRRMGTDKAVLDVGGTTLLSRVIARLETVADPLILATGAQRVAHERCTSVADTVRRRGPLGGLVAALQVAPHELSAVVAVDMPDCDAALLRELAACWAGEDAVVPLSGRGPEPLHAVYARSALAHAQAALDGPDLSVRGLLDRLRVRTVDARLVGGDALAGRFAVNLNRPDDLMRWRRREAAAPPPPPRRAQPPR